MAERTINSGLIVRAKKYLVGGVDSPVRAFNYVGGDPLIIKKGRGSKIYDHDGNERVVELLPTEKVKVKDAKDESDDD